MYGGTKFQPDKLQLSVILRSLTVLSLERLQLVGTTDGRVYSIKYIFYYDIMNPSNFRIKNFYLLALCL